MTLDSFEQESVDEVSEKLLMECTAAIAQWVRLSGTDDEMKAVEYVRGLLDEYGLETEIVLHDAYISLPGKAWIEVDGNRTVPCITHSFGASTGGGGLSGALVESGDVRGNIALLHGLAMPESVVKAERRGAVGQIYVNGDRTHEMIVSPVWGSPGLSSRSTLPTTPVVSVDDEGAALLREYVDRPGSTVTLNCEVDTRWRRTPILLASLDGKATDEFVLFSGHIDSWHLGTMDNGTANATMVEVARIMAGKKDRLLRSLRLAFWSGHSHGRYSGSAWYADTYWHDLQRHCVAHVNVDSVGGIGATVLSEGIATASMRQLGATMIDAIAGQSYRGSRVSRAGDQSFMGLGIPSLWMSLSEQPPSTDPSAAAFDSLLGGSKSGGLGWWWHTSEDTIDKIDPEFLVRDARVYVAAIAHLLTAPVLPLDVAAEVRELLDAIRDWESKAGGRFDLSDLVKAGEKLLLFTSHLEAWERKNSSDVSLVDARVLNLAKRQVLERVISVSYTSSGPFGHDSALNAPPIPLLQGITQLVTFAEGSDEERFATVDLVRSRNRVLAALQDATEVIERALDHLP